MLQEDFFIRWRVDKINNLSARDLAKRNTVGFGITGLLKFQQDGLIQRYRTARATRPVSEIIRGLPGAPRIIYDETRRGRSTVELGFVEWLARLDRDMRFWPLCSHRDVPAGIGVDVSLTPLGEYRYWDACSQGVHIARRIAAVAPSGRPLVVRLMTSIRAQG